MSIYALLVILLLSRKDGQEVQYRPKSRNTNSRIPYKDSELKKLRDRYKAYKEQK